MTYQAPTTSLRPPSRTTPVSSSPRPPSRSNQQPSTPKDNSSFGSFVSPGNTGSGGLASPTKPKKQEEKLSMVDRFWALFDSTGGTVPEDDTTSSSERALSFYDTVDMTIPEVPQVSMPSELAPAAIDPYVGAVGTGNRDVAPNTMDSYLQGDADIEAVMPPASGLMTRPVQDPVQEDTDAAVAESVSRNPLTSAQQTAIASKGTSTWERTLGQPIFTNGSFSQPSLKKAIKGAGIEDEESAILRGSFETEVGDRGPITETGYSRGNVQDMGPNSVWGQRMVRDGIMTPNGDVTSLYSGDNVFNSVYANRNGNGDFASGDGSLFKGRGLIQITGRDNYQEVQNRLDQIGVNVDIMDNPSLVNDERYALPAALAMLDYLGVNSDTVPTMSAKSLNNSINSRAPVATAEERWENVISTLEAEGKQDLADSVSKRNEYSAQREVGATVDGDVGPNTIRAIRNWARSKGLTLPQGASNLDLVVFVNENS